MPSRRLGVFWQKVSFWRFFFFFGGKKKHLKSLTNLLPSLPPTHPPTHKNLPQDWWSTHMQHVTSYRQMEIAKLVPFVATKVLP